MSKIGEVKTLRAGDRGNDQDNGPSIEMMSEVDRFSTEEMDRRKLIYAGMDNLKVLNVFRELRTQLMQINNKNNFVCMVSGINHKGGASYIASNLAAVFALDRTKTSLLIDANIYAASLDNLIIGETTVGITDFLSDRNLNIKDIVYATGVPRLRVIPIGRNMEAAAEYFSSEKMHQFIQELRARYPDRYIFIDAPPVADSSEARILAEISDLVVLVVPHGGATEEEITAAVDIVGKEKLSGLVYNN